MGWSGFRNKKEGPQQGTLFDVRQVPSQPVDSPGMQKRGRRQEMLAAMPVTRVARGHGVRGEVEQKVTARRGLGLQEEATSAGTHAGKHHRAELARQFADKTTIPPSDLEGISEFQLGRGNLGEGVMGRYRYSHRDVATPVADPDIGTLTHEIGHHVSSHHEKNQIGAHGDIAGLRSGVTISPGEEGRADAYALQHAPEARRGRTYANLVKGLSDTKYVSERESRGQPLDDDERKDQGLPMQWGDPGNYQLGFNFRR